MQLQRGVVFFVLSLASRRDLTVAEKVSTQLLNDATVRSDTHLGCRSGVHNDDPFRATRQHTIIDHISASFDRMD